MAFKPYEPIPPMVFPIKGKDYTVVALPERGWTDGILLARILAGQDHSLDGEPVEDGWKLVLGPVWDEMIADGVSMDAISRAGLSVVADYQYDREAAERVWESNISPEALAAAVAANRKQRRAKPTRSSSTAAGAKTRTRASSSGTRASRTTSEAKAKASQS